MNAAPDAARYLLHSSRLLYIVAPVVGDEIPSGRLIVSSTRLIAVRSSAVVPATRIGAAHRSGEGAFIMTCASMIFCYTPQLRGDKQAAGVSWLDKAMMGSAEMHHEQPTAHMWSRPLQ